MDRCGDIRERHQHASRSRMGVVPVSVEDMDGRGCEVSVGVGKVSM